MEKHYRLSYFYQDCENDEERVAHILQRAGGIIRFTLLVERLHDARLKLTHIQLENILKSLLEKEAIERCGEGRLVGYRFIDNHNERYGDNVPVKEEPHVVCRAPSGYDPNENPFKPDFKFKGRCKKTPEPKQQVKPKGLIKKEPKEKKPRTYFSKISDDKLLEFIEGESPNTKETSRFLNISTTTTLSRLATLASRGLINRESQTSPWLIMHMFKSRESRIAAKRRLDQRLYNRRLARLDALERLGKAPRKLSPREREERIRQIKLKINPNWKSDEEIMDFIRNKSCTTDEVMGFLQLSRGATLVRLNRLKDIGDVTHGSRIEAWTANNKTKEPQEAGFSACLITDTEQYSSTPETHDEAIAA